MDLPFGRAARTLEPLEELVQAEDSDRLRKALSSLPEKDQKILSMRYGLNGKRVHTVAQVALTQKISPQHADMIIGAAKERLARAFVNGAETPSDSLTNSEALSSSTSTTPTKSHSPETSRTGASTTPSGKKGERLPRTG